MGGSITEKDRVMSWQGQRRSRGSGRPIPSQLALTTTPSCALLIDNLLPLLLLLPLPSGRLGRYADVLKCLPQAGRPWEATGPTAAHYEVQPAFQSLRRMVEIGDIGSLGVFRNVSVAYIAISSSHSPFRTKTANSRARLSTQKREQDSNAIFESNFPCPRPPTSFTFGKSRR